MEEGTAGKVIEMRVLIFSQEESNKETKEEVDPVDQANSILSVETPKEKGSRETRVGRNSKDFVDTVGCRGTKNERIKWKQRRESKEQLFHLWKARTLQQKNCPERKYNNLGQQQKLFLGHVGEDCVYMAQEVQQAHKTKRDWHLNTSSSDTSN
jgi:hypothetical protein